MSSEFNENFNDQGEKPEFMFKPNPLIGHSYHVLQYRAEKDSYEPVGDYTLIDTDEEIDITQKKLMNLMSIMNGKKPLVDFTNLTKTRILYTIVPDTSESEKQKIVFRTYDGDGVSKENAVLEIEKGVFHET